VAYLIHLMLEVATSHIQTLLSSSRAKHVSILGCVICTSGSKTAQWSHTPSKQAIHACTHQRSCHEHITWLWQGWNPKQKMWLHSISVAGQTACQ